MNTIHANRLFVILPLAIQLTFASPAASQTASFKGLGFMSSQNPWSECTGVSDDGTTVSGHTRGPGFPPESQGFVWTATTGMMPLGNPPLTVGSPSGTADDISGDGSLVVGTTKFDGLNSAGFTWNPLSGFGPLAATVSTSLATTAATNGDGKVSVGQTRHGGYVGMENNFEEGTIWFDNGSSVGVGLGLFPGGLQSDARGVSRNGKVVVGEAQRASGEGMTAFRWDVSRGLVSLGDLPGGYHFSRANAASESGSVIVGYGTISFSNAGFNVDHRACYWDAEGIHELPNLPGNNGVSEATDISPNGRFIVGWVRNQAVNVPVIWDDVHGVRNLYDVMTQVGVDVSGWGQGYATAVSADGKTIVGYGRRGVPETTEAWVCTLP